MPSNRRQSAQRGRRVKQPSQAFESDDASGDDQTPDIGSGSFSSPALLSLTPDLMAALCLRLPLASICALSQACSHLRDMVSDDERLWMPLCEARWGAKTQLRAWLAAGIGADAEKATKRMSPPLSQPVGEELPQFPQLSSPKLFANRGSHSSSLGMALGGMSFEATSGTSHPSVSQDSSVRLDLHPSHTETFGLSVLNSEIGSQLKENPQSVANTDELSAMSRPGSLTLWGSHPGPYQSLYRHLMQMEQVVGVWRGVGSGPEGALYHIGWRDDHVEAVQLVCHTPQLEPLPRRAVFRLGPLYPHVIADVVTGGGCGPGATSAASSSGRGNGGREYCVVKEYDSGTALRGRPRALSEAAEAAAAVAIGGSLTSQREGRRSSKNREGGVSTLLGSSPPSSFSFELAHFMAASVAQTRGSIKRSSVSSAKARSMGQSVSPLAASAAIASGSSPPSSCATWAPQASSLGSLPACFSPYQTSSARSGIPVGTSAPAFMPTGVPLTTHTFLRVRAPLQTVRHPLAGLWKGGYGRYGAQAISVHYDFQGSRALIIGTKITGDREVPSDSVSWEVAASPMPLPWSDLDKRLIAWRPSLARAAEAAISGEEVEEEDDPLAFLQLAGDSEDEEDAAQSPEDESSDEEFDSLGGTMGDGRSRPGVSKVVSCYPGRGRVSRPDGSNGWVEGRLWLYDSGSIAFVWMCHSAGGEDGGPEWVDVLEDAVMVEYMRLDGDAV